MQTCLIYIEIIHDIKEKKWSWYAKTWYLWRRKFLIGWSKKRLRHRCFSVNFVKFLRTPFYEAPSGGFYFFKKLPFSVLIFSDENNIAKLAFDMWGNCSNRLWYSLETSNSFLKSLQHRCFPVNFAKFLRTSFSQKTSGQLLLSFLFILLFCHPVN